MLAFLKNLIGSLLGAIKKAFGSPSISITSSREVSPICIRPITFSLNGSSSAGSTNGMGTHPPSKSVKTIRAEHDTNFMANLTA